MLFGTIQGAQAGQATRAPATGAPGSIVGVVLDRDTRQVVANAVVSVNGSAVTAKTGPTGRFSLTPVAAGETTLVIKAPGFLDLTTEAVRVHGGETAPVTVELQASANFMERLQVTADKTPSTVGDVAGLTSVVDRSLIESRGDIKFVDAVDHEVGVVSSTQLGIFDNIMLRGMPRGDPEFTNVLLLVDGVPQTLSNNGSRVVALPMYDAGAVEITRGPNSALYGRTAIGGAVNLRTADPTATREFGFDLTAGQFQSALGNIYASGPVKKWGGFYASLGGIHDTGYFINKTSTNFDVGNASLFGKLTFAPNPKYFGSVTVNRVVSNNSTPTNVPFADGFVPLNIADPAFDRLSNINIPGPNYKQGEWRNTLNYTRVLSPSMNFVNVLSYRDVKHEFATDGDSIDTPDLAAQTVIMYPFSQVREQNIVYEEARLEMTPKTSFTDALTVGGSYEYTSGSQTQDLISTADNPDGFTINYIKPVIPATSTWLHDTSAKDYHLNVAALFAQYMIQPTAKWIVSAGGRFDHFGLNNAREGEPVTQDSFDAFSPKASVTYRLVTNGGDNSRPTVNVYGLYSHAFNPPRVPSLLLPSDADSNLTPEDIDNYEGGVKGTGYHGRLAFEATYFWMREDGVVLTTKQGPLFIDTNAGQQKYQGVETGGSWVFNPKVSVRVNAAFYNNRFGDFVIQEEEGDTVLTGNRLPISPDYIINWGATVKPWRNFDILLDVKHTGAMMVDRENSYELDPYTLVDLSGSWRRGPIRITVAAHNMLNEEYYGNGDEFVLDPGRPRQVLVTTSFKFK